MFFVAFLIQPVLSQGPYDLSITILKDFSTCTGAIDRPSASAVMLKKMVVL